MQNCATESKWMLLYVCACKHLYKTPTKASGTECNNIFERPLCTSNYCFIFVALVHDEDMCYWWSVGNFFWAVFEFQPPQECQHGIHWAIGMKAWTYPKKTTTYLRLLPVLCISWKVLTKIPFDQHVFIKDHIFCKQIVKNAKYKFFTLTFYGVFLKI